MTDDLQFPDPSCADAWHRYLAMEDAGNREEISTALVVFLSLMPDDGRQEFVESWCRLHLDGAEQPSCETGGMEWMRLPLFRSVFAPALEAGRKAGRAGHARWSAQLYGLFCRVDGPYRLYEPHFNDLLREALHLDAADYRSRSLLVASLLSDLDYFCHELPDGLVVDGQTINAHVRELELLLRDAGCLAGSRKGLAALELIAGGDWSEQALESAFDLLSNRFDVGKVLRIEQPKGTRSA